MLQKLIYFLHSILLQLEPLPDKAALQFQFFYMKKNLVFLMYKRYVVKVLIITYTIRIQRRTPGSSAS